MIIKRSLTISIPKTLIAVVYDNLSLSLLTLCDGQVDLEGAENIDDAVTCFGKQNPGENFSKEQHANCIFAIEFKLRTLCSLSRNQK